MLDKPANPDDMGRSAGQGNNSGNRIDRSGGEPAMEVGGFQIVYDLLSEEKLRTRMDQGMKELWIPLPGTRHVMVCPAEVALRRGSSKCRMLPPDSPELTATGDARGQPPRSQPLAHRQFRGERTRQRGVQPAADPAQALGLRMQQLQHFLGQRRVATVLLHLLPPLRAWQVADGIEQIAGLAPTRRLLRVRHQASCRLSQALAKRRSRSTVGAETPITMAISSRLMPPK